VIVNKKLDNSEGYYHVKSFTIATFLLETRFRVWHRLRYSASLYSFWNLYMSNSISPHYIEFILTSERKYGWQKEDLKFSVCE